MFNTHPSATELRRQQAQQTRSVVAADLTSEFTETLNYNTSAGDIKVFARWPHFHAATGMVINLHGDGFIYPHTDRDTLFCKHLCLAANVAVFDVNYPLAPEHPFPVPLLAAYETIQKIQDRYREQLGWPTIIGHSTGANLVVGSQLLALQQGKPLAQQVILDYPILDLDTDPLIKSYPLAPEEGFSAEQIRTLNDFYRPNGDHHNLLISPITATTADLRNFPETFILTADQDPAMAEGERFGQQLITAGSMVTVRRYAGSRHGFTVAGTDAFELAIHDIAKRLD